MILSFKSLNPYINLIYFLMIILGLYMIPNPVIITAILICSLALNTKFCPVGLAKKMSSYMVMGLLLIIINPLVSHRGMNILFYIGYTPITLESAVWGMISALRLMSLLLIGNYFNCIMDYEKIDYILSPLGKNMSLIIGLSIKFIPEYLEKLRNIRDTQKNKGIDVNSRNKKEAAKSLSLILNAFFFITLEEGIITIKSIKARGFENREKSSRVRQKFKTADYTAVFVFVITTASYILFKNKIVYDIYPEITRITISSSLIIVTLITGICIMLPSLLEKGRKIYVRYKAKRSKLFLSRR